MKATDDLHRLIQSLSPAEKRYFKIFASRHAIGGKNNYLKLYNVVEKQKEYDEEKVKKKLQGEKFAKYLAAEKKYLFDLIMRAMRNFYAEKSTYEKIRDLLQDEAFLKRKGLYDLQEKTVKKAKKLAEEWDFHLLLFEILHREKTMLFARKRQNLVEINEQTQQEKTAIINKIINESEYETLKDIALIAYRTGVNLKNNNQAIDIKKYLDSPLLQNPDNALTISSRLHFHNFFAWHSRLKGDFKNFHHHMQQQVNLYETNPLKIKQLPTSYKLILSNYLGSCHRIGKYGEFKGALSKIKSMPVLHEDDEVEVFQNVYSLELLYYLNTAAFDKALALVPDIKKGLTRHKKKLVKSSEITLRFNVVLLLLILSRWDEAMGWLHEVIDEKTDSRIDIQHFSRLLMLVLHYEMDNLTLLESLFRSTYRYLYNLEQIHKYERALLQHLKNIFFAPSSSESIDACKALKNELLQIQQDPQEKNSVGLDVVLFWLNSKIERKTVLQVVMEDFEKDGLK